jgi:hypothetical protein
MALDADQAALLVRVTARVSASILAANLLVGAARVGPAGITRGTHGDARRHERNRTADVGVFVAFIISHTVHFVCVGLLALATNGANLDSPLGYTPVVALGILFYIACAAILRVKLRGTDGWATRRLRNTEVWLLVAVWAAFMQAYLTRLLQSALFAALAIALVYSVARFLRRALAARGESLA